MYAYEFIQYVFHPEVFSNIIQLNFTLMIESDIEIS